MRRVLSIALLAVLALAACVSETRLEVATNSGGTLDCRSATVQYAMFDTDVSQPGKSSVLAAAAEFIDTEFMPDGLPRIEFEANGQAAVAIVDWDGNRVGRVLVAEHESGWHAQSTESCG